MTTTPQPQANIAEFAAQQVEKMPTYLDPNAIAQIIFDSVSSVEHKEEAQEAAEEIIKGLQPLFDHVADHIRKQPIEEIQETLTLRDKFVHDLALSKVREEAYELIKNPVKKPRKNFEPLARKGIWWEELNKILDGLKKVPASYEDHISSVWKNGYTAATRAMADKLRGVRATFDPGDGNGVRVRQPNDYADLVEKMKP